MEHFKTKRGKPGILQECFRLRKDWDSKTEPRRPIFLQILAAGQGKAVNI